MNNDPTTAAAIVLVAIGLCSLWGIFWALRQGRIVSAIGGLHLNVLFMISFGPLFYVLFEPPPERLPYMDTVGYFSSVGGWFLAGYAIWLAIEWVAIVGPNRKSSKFTFGRDAIPIPVLLILMGSSLVGYFGAQLELATSGIGTILIVMKNFLYPTLLAVLLRTRWTNIGEVALACGWGATVIGLSAISVWRSDLVVTGFCLLLFVCVRKPRFALPLVLFGLLGLWIVTPTLQYKKTNYDEYKVSPVDGIITSQNIDSEKRTQFLSEFVSIRLNYVREMAYMQRGLEMGMTPRLEGQSYVDSFYQLIPRVIWRNKPSFNYSSGYVIPRDIGLVEWGDESTSWGVNAYGEFIMNFSAEFLVLFVPVLFLGFHSMERGTVWSMKTPSITLLTRSTFFFLTISLVNLVNLGTFILWGVICLVVLDRFLSFGGGKPNWK